MNIYDITQMLVAGNAGGSDGAAGGIGFLIPMIAILAIFFWLTHRSQKKKDRERREMLDSIKVGNDILTIGGIHGRITAVSDDGFEVRVNDEKDVKIRFSRGAVNKVLTGDEQPEMNYEQ